MSASGRAESSDVAGRRGTRVTLEQFSLAGKVAVVIGAANPLGRAAAVSLAEAGADVGVATTTRSQREEVAANSCANEIWALDRKGFAQAIDAADERDVDSLVERAISELGRLDILANALDLHFAKPALDISLAEWRRVIDANLTGVFLACRAAGREMLRRESGRVVNLSSVLAERGMANGSAYCAAQAGVLNLTRALALEWARSGVTVNAVGAGWIDAGGFLADENMKRQLERYLPYKRLAEPEEISGAVVYLASDAAAYLTGQVVWIEGGALSHV
ncbi:MAG: SDR family oxidoreductase [Chloroflexi bacterium]|nr:MAG: SDR family oxidoreductase [Chloroflexota bacterium]